LCQAERNPFHVGHNELANDNYLWDFPTASKLISENSSLNEAQLQFLVGNDDRVKQLQAAYPKEILVADDVRNNNALNSYPSLHPILPPPPTPPPAPSSTEELAPPVISTLTSAVASTSITISWTTNKPATSQLLFGSSTAMTANVPADTTLTTSHSERISGLVPGTTYYYEARSSDSSGKTTNSTQQTFTTSVASETAPPAETPAPSSTSTTASTATSTAN
jgi:hypothetical protein